MNPSEVPNMPSRKSPFAVVREKIRGLYELNSIGAIEERLAWIEGYIEGVKSQTVGNGPELKKLWTEAKEVANARRSTFPPSAFR